MQEAQEATEQQVQRKRQSTQVAAVLMIFILFAAVMVAGYFQPIPLVIGGRGVVFGCLPNYIRPPLPPSLNIAPGGRNGEIKLFDDLDGQKTYMVIWGF